MQLPTYTGIRIRSPIDAHVIFHAVSLNMLHMITRRLDTEERRAISSGCVYVWEERGPNAEATGLGIERWTDSIRWGPSRVRDEFLFYHEKESEQADLELGSDSESISPLRSPPRPGPSRGSRRESLIKQTYSVFVETPKGRRKWHLIAYFTQDSLEYLRSIDDIPHLASLHVPPGKYKSARSSKSRPPRDPQFIDSYEQAVGPHAGTQYQPRYAPFTAKQPIAPVTLSMRPPPPTVLQSTAPTNNLPFRTPLPRSPVSSGSSLAPLTYLQNIPPIRRHPLDEKALMSFTSGLS